MRLYLQIYRKIGLFLIIPCQHAFQHGKFIPFRHSMRLLVITFEYQVEFSRSLVFFFFFKICLLLKKVSYLILLLGFFSPVNTKVDMRFNVQNAYWLSDRVRERIMQMVCNFFFLKQISLYKMFNTMHLLISCNLVNAYVHEGLHSGWIH